MEIPLTKGKVAVIDDEDYPLVCEYNWTYSSNGYGYARAHIGNRTYIGMHSLIMDTPDGVMVDHRDGDGLNNRRSNLKIVDRSQNGVNRKLNKNNTSGYRGVSWHKQKNRWGSYVRENGVKKFLGYFNDPEEAFKTYEDYMRKTFGEHYQNRS